MTTLRVVLCDHDGCAEVFELDGTGTDDRRRLRAGWVRYREGGRVIDLCPEHAQARP